MTRFYSFFLQNICVDVLLLISVVRCSFMPVLEYEDDISWDETWKHDTSKRGNEVVDDWKQIDIRLYQLFGHEWPYTLVPSPEETAFVKKAMKDMLKIVKQVVLQVRKHDQKNIFIPRRCINENEPDNRRSVRCKTGDVCSPRGKCYDIDVPHDHASDCYVDGERQYTKGHGVSGDLLVYFGIADCGPEIANAIACQRDPQYDRPMAGRISICHKRLKNFMSKPKQYVNVLLHELFHILLMPMAGYKYRFDNGTRRRSTYLRVQRSWKSAHGTFTREAFLSTLPSVVRVIHEHFNCPDLEGAELDNSLDKKDKNAITVRSNEHFAHFEMRLFPDTLLSPIYMPGVELSQLEMAFLKDSGWYRVNDTMGRNLSVTRGKDCQFARQSCYEYMQSVNFDRQAMYPYCDMDDKNKWMCSMDNRQTGYCSGEMSNDDVKPEYHLQTSVTKFIGSPMSEYCPMVVPKYMAGDYSPYCSETHEVDWPALETDGGHECNKCVRVETLNVKGSKTCPSVESTIVGICLRTECTPHLMIFSFGGQNFTCSKEESGKRLNFDFTSKISKCKIDGSFCCPDFETFCPEYSNSTQPVLRFQYCDAYKLSSNFLIYVVVSFLHFINN